MPRSALGSERATWPRDERAGFWDTGKLTSVRGRVGPRRTRSGRPEVCRQPRPGVASSVGPPGTQRRRFYHGATGQTSSDPGCWGYALVRQVSKGESRSHRSDQGAASIWWSGGPVGLTSGSRPTTARAVGPPSPSRQCPGKTFHPSVAFRGPRKNRAGALRQDLPLRLKIVGASSGPPAGRESSLSSVSERAPGR